VTTPDPATAAPPQSGPSSVEPAEAPARETGAPAAEERDPDDLLPREIVRSLDAYIIGQNEAKRAVAVALRNRVRRRRLNDEMRREVLPKNILMIGPTGVGKTEIARRLARLTSSPFLKVEATKFTEVGYVGRDVEAIVRDLLEQTITEVHDDRIDDVEGRAREIAENRILDILVEAELPRPSANGAAAPASAGSQGAAPPPAEGAGGEPTRLGSRKTLPPADPARRRLRRRLAARLQAKQLEERYIEVEVEEPYQPAFEGFAGSGLEEVGYSLSDFFSQMVPTRKRMKRMRVGDARTALVEEETDRLIDMDRVYDDAIRDVEEAGIVFIDEVDKICGPAADRGPDVSGEGVQRDLLPLLEGSVVHTRYGSVHTDHILFIAAGAFTAARPSDLIPEFQGRFPIRVELSPLTESDLQRILVEPTNALTKQYRALLETERVDLDFSEDGIAELARQAHRVNEDDENIGARRLYTILERVLDDLSFRAEEYAGQRVVVDAAMVQARLGGLVGNDDARRYIL
jgi:ATP-dependent HslUV protease ATP-binding subunit HslU